MADDYLRLSQEYPGKIFGSIDTGADPYELDVVPQASSVTDSREITADSVAEISDISSREAV